MLGIFLRHFIILCHKVANVDGGTDLTCISSRALGGNFLVGQLHQAQIFLAQDSLPPLASPQWTA